MAAPEIPATWSDLILWGQERYRDRRFGQDEFIPSRPGLLYLVHQGAARILGFPAPDAPPALLGIWRAGQPYTIVGHSPFEMRVYAHLEETAVVWLYWRELQQWPALYQAILEQFHQRHQSQLAWLTLLGQKSTLKRLLYFWLLLSREVGEISPEGYRIPFPLTHCQIAQAIASTRVTVSRLLGRLQRQGVLISESDRYWRVNLTALQSELLSETGSPMTEDGSLS
ncbi:MAG: Crp/Fnr family transcriptional regulator [Cyanobacteriota bacterium]|nr:Crp/Fnr family transcriptional regulator [Cyanobacteriota bacterium]